MTTMGTALLDEYEAFCPCLRPEIVFGPPLRLGASTVYHLKDRFSNWFYRVGAKEYFVFSRMDGTRSLQQISEEYAIEFGRRLNEQSWSGIFRIIEKRQMLADAADMVKLEEWKQQATQKKRESGRGLLRRRFVLLQPDRFLEKLLPWFAFAFHPVFVITMLLAVLALEIFVGINVTTIRRDVIVSYSHPLNIVAFFVLSWLIAIVHEYAHGLTCKRFGGHVSEIGIIWRFLSFFPYCKIDDVLLFHNRWQRVSTVMAGVFVNLLCLIPFGWIWWFAPVDSMLKDVCALMLLSFNFSSFINLIPFIELDGYFALNHILGTVDLRKEAHLFWKRGALKLLLRRGAGNASIPYTARDKRIYAIYGFFSLLFTTAFLCGMMIFWFILGRNWLGDRIMLLVLGVVAVLFLLLGPGKPWIVSRFHLKEHWTAFTGRLGLLRRKEVQS